MLFAFTFISVFHSTFNFETNKNVWARDADNKRVGSAAIAERERDAASIGPGASGRISVTFVSADEFNDIECDAVPRAGIDDATSARASKQPCNKCTRAFNRSSN